MVKCLWFLAIAPQWVKAGHYENLYEKYGYGTCVDASDHEYDGWGGEVEFTRCEHFCDEGPFCIGFDYFHREDNHKDWCVLRYTDGILLQISKITDLKHVVIL